MFLKQFPINLLTKQVKVDIMQLSNLKDHYRDHDTSDNQKREVEKYERL